MQDLYIYVIHRPGGPYRENCARGEEYDPMPQAEGRTQDQGHSFSLYGPTRPENNVFIFPAILEVE